MMSFFASLLGGGSGGVADKYAKTQADLTTRNTALAGGLKDAYDSAARAGAWDPNAALDSLKNDTAYQSKIDYGNSAATARTLGYRPGDSEPLLAANAIGQKASLAYADSAERIRSGALQAGWQAAQGLAGQSSNIYGESSQMNAPLIQYGAQKDAQQGSMLSGLLGTAMPFLSPGTAGAKFLSGAFKAPTSTRKYEFLPN